MKARHISHPINDEQNDLRESFVGHICITNPTGAMGVLDKAGFNGYMSPQDMEELFDACNYYIDTKGDEAVYKLMEAMPEYQIFKERQLANITNYKKNAQPVATNQENEKDNILDVLSREWKKLDQTTQIIILFGLGFLLLK